MTITRHEAVIISADTAAELAGRVLAEGDVAYAADDASLKFGPGVYEDLPNAGGPITKPEVDSGTADSADVIAALVTLGLVTDTAV